MPIQLEMRSPRARRLLFVAFCLVVFSKIIWYDLRVYVPADGRRGLLTACFAAWIVAQGLVYLPVARPMLRRFDRTALFWVVAVTPYLALGFIEGRVNVFLLGDIARYALPVGYLLFGAWAVRNIPPRTILLAIAGSLAVCIGVRTGLHLVLADQTIRYGLAWEAMFTSLLLASALVARGWRYAALLVVVAVTGIGVAVGQTRSLLLGTAAVALVIGGYAVVNLRSRFVPSLRLISAAGVGLVLAAVPLLLPVATFGRTQLVHVVADRDTELFSEGEVVPTPAESTPATREDIRHAAGLDRWEEAIEGGGRSLDVRIAEAAFFISRLTNDTKSLLLGAGGGAWVTVQTPAGPRVVRGAHNTYVTLLHRHGILLGTLLCLFTTFYGLRAHASRLIRGPSPEWRILLLALIAYRVAAIGMAQLRQGLFDDPMVFLSISIAVTAGSASRTGSSGSRPSSSGDHADSGLG